MDEVTYVLGALPILTSYILYSVAAIRSRRSSVMESPSSKKTSEENISFRSAVASLVAESARKNIVPGLVIFSIGLAIVLAFYLSDGAKATFDKIAEWQESTGVLFSILSTGLFGGFLPSLSLLVRGMVPAPRLLNFGYNVFTWGHFGATVSALYMLQAVLFGEEANVATVVVKVIFDQFVANPFALMPNAYIWLSLPQHHYSCNAQLDTIADWQKFAVTLCGQQVATWIVWIPSTAAVYSLPVNLQLACFNVLIMFFSLVLSSLHVKAASDEMLEKAEVTAEASKIEVEEI